MFNRKQRALADRDELHRDGAEAHPGKDVGEGGEKQPRDRLTRHRERLAADQRQRAQDRRRASAGELAGEQPRPLLQRVLEFRLPNMVIEKSPAKPVRLTC